MPPERSSGAPDARPSPSRPSPSRSSVAARIVRAPWGLYLAVAFAVLLLVAVIAPQLLTTHLPTAVDYGAALQPPSWAHPFGTDESGRDLYTRVVWGARDSSPSAWEPRP